MRIELLIAMLVVSIAATAQQTATDSAVNSKPGIDSLLKGVLERNGGRITYQQLMDTTGDALMAQYGMRRYDPRIGRYMPVAPEQNAVNNPYAYTKKQPAVTKKKPVKQSKVNK